MLWLYWWSRISGQRSLAKTFDTETLHGFILPYFHRAWGLLSASQFRASTLSGAGQCGPHFLGWTGMPGNSLQRHTFDSFAYDSSNVGCNTNFGTAGLAAFNLLEGPIILRPNILNITICLMRCLGKKVTMTESILTCVYTLLHYYYILLHYIPHILYSKNCTYRWFHIISFRSDEKNRLLVISSFRCVSCKDVKSSHFLALALRTVFSSLTRHWLPTEDTGSSTNAHV